MKVNVKQAILDYENNPVGKDITLKLTAVIDLLNSVKKMEDVIELRKSTTAQLKERESLTLQDVIKQALNVASGEAAMPNSDKARAFNLTMRVMNSEEVEFPAEDIVFIKGFIEKVYNPLVVGRAFDLLENNGPKQEPLK